MAQVKAYTDDPITFDVPDTMDPANAFDKVVAHLTPDSTDGDTVRRIEMAKSLVAESGTVEPPV